jgi:hypothetical protein
LPVAEAIVLSILAILLLLFLVLSVVFWLGSLFAQSYFYTEPAGGLYWRGPAAAGALAFFFLLWAVLNVVGAASAPDQRYPYPGILKFNTTVDLLKEPMPEFESKRKQQPEPVIYELDRSLKGGQYKQKGGTEYWNAGAAEYIKFKHDGTEYNFVRDRDAAGDPMFVDNINGWTIKANRMGYPSYSSFLRLLVYFLLNVFHLTLWVVAFWLVLRFAPGLATVLALAFWVTFTVIVLAVLFDQPGA